MTSHDHEMGEQDCSECGIVIACETCGACLGAACDLCDDCDHHLDPATYELARSRLEREQAQLALPGV